MPIELAANSDVIENLSTTQDKLLDKLGLSDPDTKAALSTGQELLSQQSPLDQLLAEGAPMADPAVDATTIDIGQSNEKPRGKRTQDRISELGIVPVGGVPLSSQRNVHTLESGPIGGAEATRNRTLDAPDVFSNPEHNSKIVQLTLKRDFELAGAKSQIHYNLATSGQVAAQPMEPSQPPVKSPVGGLSVSQTGNEPRSQFRELEIAQILPINANNDVNKMAVNLTETSQRDRIVSLEVQSLNKNLANNSSIQSI